MHYTLQFACLAKKQRHLHVVRVLIDLSILMLVIAITIYLGGK